jgi:hypothetical protein
MQYSWWDAVKDFLGAIGSLFIAVPWLRDFWLRNRRSQVREVPAEGRLGKLKAKIENSVREKIESPKIADFVWTVIGLLCIFASFLISFIRGMRDLLG